YARLDKQGGLAVCRLSEGREEIITRLPAHGKPPFGPLETRRHYPDSSAPGGADGHKSLGAGLRHPWPPTGDPARRQVGQLLRPRTRPPRTAVVVRRRAGPTGLSPAEEPPGGGVRQRCATLRLGHRSRAIRAAPPGICGEGRLRDLASRRQPLGDRL